MVRLDEAMEPREPTEPGEPGDPTGPRPSRALVPAPAQLPMILDGREPTRMRLARSLDELRQGMLVHVDESGQVRSPLRYRLLTALEVGFSLSVAGLGAAMYAAFFGPIAGALAGMVLGGAVVLATGRRRRLERVAALISDNRLVEAEALCRRTLSSSFVPVRSAAAAHHGLSVVASRRGDFDEALREVRAAMLCQRRVRRAGLMIDLLAYSEITLLVNLGRVGEARTRLAARGAVPDGDYLRVLHYCADLAVQFAEKRLALDEDELWHRSRRALGLSGMPHLLALCGWATSVRGDEAMSDHLVAEAIDRATPDCPVTFPSLWAWVETRRPRLALHPPDPLAAP